MEKTQKTEAELHADLVVKHINDLEGIKAEVVKVENYEAAEVIAQSIALIRSSHISNDFLSRENEVLKSNLRIHIASMAMATLIRELPDKSTKTIAEKSFLYADDMLYEAKKKKE